MPDLGADLQAGSATAVKVLQQLPLLAQRFRVTLERKKLAREFSVVIEQDEDGYFVASVPALRGCHTQAKSLDVLMKRIREAIELCLETTNP